MLEYFETLSNRSRWGEDDQLGTLNHITGDVRLAAARAVRHGRSVSCAWDVTDPGDMRRSVLPGPPAGRRWRFVGERLSLVFHGSTVTHIDAPCHLSWDGLTYNGRPPHDAAAVTAAANGILTRGVLLDVAAARGVPWLEPGEGVFPSDVEEAERRQGVRVRPGDAVLLRTGNGRARHENGPVTGESQTGWDVSCLPWLHDRGVALIGADSPQEVQPSGHPDVGWPVHAVALSAMGLWLLDNCDLEVCATTANALRQWDFQLTVAPLRLTATTGSPVNPIATF